MLKADSQADIHRSNCPFDRGVFHDIHGFMGSTGQDMNPDIEAGPDEGESVGLMEPLLISEDSRRRSALADQALTLAREAAAFRTSLPQGIMAALADLVRAMNCYYSNLIEGHDTHPVDIERAMRDDYSTNPRKRSLQLEARAHIAVQAWIDSGGMVSKSTEPDVLMEIHRRFCAMLPAELLVVADADTGKGLAVIPGTLRTRHVRVGRHIPVSPGALPRFLERFAAAYRSLGPTDAILAAAAAHHRLLWIHPFLDGNGRVARLMTHAMLLEALDTGAVWSVARGLARAETVYKQHLAACDLPRRNDLDGRGTLSEEALAGFTAFFLETCIDQVRFMRKLVAPDELRRRILSWAGAETQAGRLLPRTGQILEAVLYRGELPRSDIPSLLDVTDRHARRITSELVERGILAATGTKGPLHLAFPAALAQDWMPGLFPPLDDTV